MAKAVKNRKKRKTSTGDRITRGACGIMILCLGILMFVCLFVTSEAAVIVQLRAVMQGLAGAICPLIPIIVCWAGILLTFSAQAQVNVRKIVCFVVLFICVSSIFQLYQINDVRRYMEYQHLSEDYITFIRLSYIRSSAIKTGGGVLGALLAWPMWRALDLWGSMLLFIFVIIADLMLITNVTLYQVGDYISVLFGDMRQNLSERREERRAAREAVQEEEAPTPSALKTPKGKTVKPAPEPVESEAQEPPAPAPSRVIRAEAELEKPRKRRARRKVEEDPYVAEEPVYDPYVAPAYGMGEAPYGTRDVQPEVYEAQGYSDVGYSDYDDAPSQGETGYYSAYSQEEMPPFQYDDRSAYGDVTVHQTAYEEVPQLYIENIETTSAPAPVAGSKVLDLPDFMLRRREEAAREAEAAAQMQPGTEEWPPPEEPWDVPEEEVPAPPASDDSVEAPLADASFDEEPAAPVSAPLSPWAAQNQNAARQSAPAVMNAPARVDAEETQPSPQTRRLDDTPITIPKKAENPLAKPVEPYFFPPVDLLKNGKPPVSGDTRQRDEEGAAKLVGTLKSFGVQAKVLNVTHGPAITRYELQPAPGVKVSRILGLVDDIALNMASAGVRIEAPIPGKPAVGIEIPNESISAVALRDVLESDEARRHPSPLACALGKDIAGRNIIADLAKMPHVLIAGATGSGKSVCINTIINSIIFRATPEQVRLILIDPKVVELSVYNGIPHLLVPVVTDPKKASGALSWAVMEMDQRYKRFAGQGVRDIRGYNASLQPDEERMPQIVVIIDELADLMMVAPGEVEESICRLAQLARAAGIHLVIATQRPSVNVITGVIKANIPSRIAFAVSSQVDSRTILDSAGAEKLLGKGDMLFAPQGTNKPLRVQGCFVSDEEVSRVVGYVKQRFAAEYNEDVIEHLNNTDFEPEGEEKKDGEEVVDELLEQAIELAVDAGQASISMLQRRLRVGYARAGRLIDEMARRGIVAQAEGAKPRAVLMTREEFRKLKE